MSFCSCPQSLSFFAKPHRSSKPLTSRISASADVPDFLSADWLESRRKKPFGPRLSFSAEEAVRHQLDALKYNDQPHHDYGVEVMYRFAGFDPFQRSTYFGRFFDLGQFERFRRIFHHSTYRVLLGHQEREILSILHVNEVCEVLLITKCSAQFNDKLKNCRISTVHLKNLYKQRVWVRGTRPEEEEIFQFTMVQRVGGSWDGYWLTESVLHDGDTFSGGVAY